MADTAGRAGYVYINATDVSAYVDDASMQRIRDRLDTSAFADTSKTSIGGLYSATFTIGGTYDGAAATIGGYLNTWHTTDAGVSISYSPAGNTAGNEKFTGTIHVASYTYRQTSIGKVEWSANCESHGGTAGLDRGTI